MPNNFDEFQKLGKEQLEAASTAAASLAKGFQTIAAETTDYSKKSLEANSAYVEKLLGAKSLDDAIQTHSEYAKSAYEGFITQATKIGELYTNLAKEAFKPVESMIAKVQAAAGPMTARAAAGPMTAQAAAGPMTAQAAAGPTKAQTAADPTKAQAAAVRTEAYAAAK